MQQQVLLFDGVCKLCNGWSRFVIRYDKQQRFQLATVQSDAGQQILLHLGLPTDHYDTMVYLEHGQAYLKSTAFLKAIVHFPFPFRLLGVFILLPLGFRDKMYDLIARNRYRIFGRYDQCIVPKACDLRRFL
ncbi:MAG: thiol-disulfide oxidoreductase DCC family protein [Gammaproteobacteria bacterium]|nr:thiol-disulfide oxidoreductase DCC family protein [Gammaproteobacteria bacterium]